MMWQGQNSLQSNSESYTKQKVYYKRDFILFNVCINNVDAEYKTHLLNMSMMKS